MKEKSFNFCEKPQCNGNIKATQLICVISAIAPRAYIYIYIYIYIAIYIYIYIYIYARGAMAEITQISCVALIFPLHCGFSQKLKLFSFKQWFI